MIYGGKVKWRKKRATSFLKTRNMKNFLGINMSKCRYKDVYHAALIYCLGISETPEET